MDYILYKLKLVINGDASEPWDLGFQDSATLVHEKIINLHNNIMFYLILIIIMVLWIIIEMILTNSKIKFAHKYLTHGTNIEIIWTILPAVILLIIAWPSFELLYFMDEVIDPMITLKVIGHQWYWSYEYSDYTFNKIDNTIEFDSYMIATEDLKEGDLRLLEVDNKVLLPINTNIRVIVTAADVLHSWAIPSLGIKIDCVPGRLNQTSMIIKRPGIYYGQCSEICGVQHGFMPIVIQGCDLNDYLTFIASNQKSDIDLRNELELMLDRNYVRANKKLIVEKELINNNYTLPPSVLSGYDYLIYEHRGWCLAHPEIDEATKNARFEIRKTELLEELEIKWFEIYKEYRKKIWESSWGEMILNYCERFNATSELKVDCSKAYEELITNAFEKFEETHMQFLKVLRGVDENGNTIIGQKGSQLYDEYGYVKPEYLDSEGNFISSEESKPKKPNLKEFLELFEKSEASCKETQIYFVLKELVRQEEEQKNKNNIIF